MTKVKPLAIVAAPILLLFSVLVQAAEPPVGRTEESIPVRHYSIEQFLEIARLSGVCFAADNAHLLVSSDEDGIRNAYAIRLEDGDARLRGEDVG